MQTSSLTWAGLAVSVALTALPAAADETVKFGFVMPFSGWFQPIDAATVNGALLAVKEINAAGGVLGQQIEVVKFDTKSEPTLGADGAMEVIGQGAKAIMVTSDFDFGAPGAFVAQQNGVLAFAGAADPKFGVDGIGNMAYTITNASMAQAALLAEWAYEQQGWKTAYVLLDDTVTMTKSLCGSFGRRWKELGGEASLLGTDTFLNGDASIASQVSRINALPAKPDVIMLCSYAPGGPSAIRQLRAAGLETPIVSGESMDGDYWAGAVPGLSNFYVASFGSIYGDDADPAVVDFFKRYEAEYGKRADVSYALRGYSVIEAWAKAAERAGSTDPAEVGKVLDTFTDEPLLVGPTTWTPEIHIPVKRPMTIIQSQNGTFSFVTKVAPREVTLN